MYIAPHYRQKGFGELLVKQCLEAAKDMGFNEVYLFTDKEKLKNWYLKMNWTYVKSTLHRSTPIDILIHKQNKSTDVK